MLLNIHGTDGVLKFVAKIGEKVFEFILDTAEKIMHAATWVSHIQRLVGRPAV